MKRTLLFTFCGVTLCAIMAGCATTGGGSQVEASIYDTHRRVAKLDKSLDESIGKLNETAVSLSTRVEQSDQQTRLLRSMMEETQVKLDNLEREIKAVKAAVYREQGLTLSPQDAAAASAVAGGVVVETPGEPVGVTPTEPAVTPVPGETPVSQGAAAPVSTGAALGDPKLFYQQAQKTFANGDYDQAQQQFAEFLQRFPAAEDAANAQFWVAKCHMNLGRYQDAIREFEVVRTQYPTSNKVPFALHNEAVAYAHLGQVKQAESLFEEIVENYPTSPAADNAKSDLAKLRGQ